MPERLSLTVGNAEIVFETGRIAKQAQGSVLVTCGETMVLSVACVSPDLRPGQDFFPLTVDYREKSSSAGRIPGNFFRREGRPSEREVLVARVTDRPLRPLFPKGFLNEIQVCSTVFSADNVNNPDIMSINGSSAALHISRIPWDGPIGAVRVGRINGEYVVNAPMEDMEQSELDVVMAGTADAIVMVEGGAEQVSEEVMLGALEFGHEHIKIICQAIEELRSRVGEEKMTFEPPAANEEVKADVTAFAEERMKKALATSGKQERADALAALKDELTAHLTEKYGEEGYAERAGDIKKAYGDLEKAVMRGRIIKDGVRLDGRDTRTVRPITIEVGVLPRTHGSCLFTRGETQALVSTTLGTSRDEQRLDELSGEEFKRFMLHYNFPPWSVGEVRPLRGPGRREVGHGRLAERALEGVLPFKNETTAELLEAGLEGQDLDAENGDEVNFPYTVRVLSDITESNGSSSMATVCGGTMSLMDAGVPITDPVAGIAMGLIKEGDEIRILTDILGAEDHLGDMDFKVCGTRTGITAFQMDVKVKGISSEIMKNALDQARDGRLHVLDKMEEVLAEPRADISPYAPRIYTIHIDPEKIREVIGPGGKVIREIQRQSGAEIEIEDDGTVNVAAVDAESAQSAIDMIRAITATPEVGQLYHGTVTRIMNFGAFVSIVGNKEGLVHISELAPGHVRNVTDEVNIGDEVDVKVIEIDKMGRINLSKVAADRELGRVEPETEEQRQQRMDRERERSDRGDRGDRGGDRGRRDRGGRPGGGRDRGPRRDDRGPRRDR